MCRKIASLKQVVLFFALISQFVDIARAQDSSFVELQFDGLISIESPKSWIYQNEVITNHIKTTTEAALAFSGISKGQSDNRIYFAANAYTKYKTSSATVRLSARSGNTLTQGQVHELSTYSKADLHEALNPSVEEIANAMKSIEGVSYAKALDMGISRNESLNCIYTEFEYGKIDGVTLSQTWVCPIGTSTIKLSTSYRKSEQSIFKPVIFYIWKSLHLIGG